MRLLEPFALGPLTLKNRVIMPAMDPSLCPDGDIEARTIEHYALRARGGVGLIITGNMSCEARGRVSPFMPLIESDARLPGLRRLAEAVHAEGGVIFFQISHGGRQTTEGVSADVVAPSALGCPLLRSRPRPLEDAEVDAIADRFAEAAHRAQRAGADGVEFHMAHGYLVCQFLSPYSNTRADRWGGDEAGRARLAEEIVRRARALVGPTWPLQCRLSADEMVAGGITPPLARRYARRLVAAGATSISVSACNYESYIHNMPSYYAPRGAFAPLAAIIREGLGAPVVAVGRFDPASAEAALAAGQADLIAMGRALLADPDLARRLEQGATPRPCLACNRCVEAISTGPIRCAVNPALGHLAPPAPPAPRPKRVAIIGGGPAGLMASVEAARRGHSVSLITARLGGHLNEAGAAPAKTDVHAFQRFLEAEARAAGVDILLGEVAADLSVRGPDQAMIAARLADAEAMAWAVGATHPPRPPIEGLDAHPHVRWPDEALAELALGASTLIIGGGSEGAEIADALAPHAGPIWVVERRRKIGLGLPSSVRQLLEDRLTAAGVALLTRREVASISPEGVRLADGRGRLKETLPAPARIVLAVGVRAAPSPEGATRLGDALKPASILEAARDGWRWGREV
ncbi:NAD(P)/FAD-dependent oxidoreductase [Myxococcota bacterium]|nr:NAD(P)/FAD-dependent oxidoreductase [Myxococcota bacterium]MBU1430798.1 NAD(P)/FAD-dependent oxidoreductase [Myxococcota bacterium]